MENAVDRESAELEFERFAQMAKINLERYGKDDSKEGFGALKENFIQCVQRGSVSVDENGWPVIRTDYDKLKEVKIIREPMRSDEIMNTPIHIYDMEKKETSTISSWIGKSFVDVNKLSAADYKRLKVVYDLFRDYRD